MKIYTRTGDDGTTGTGRKVRLHKTHPEIIAVGVVDELNSNIGLCVSSIKTNVEEYWATEILNDLNYVQNLLFEIGANITQRKSINEGSIKIIENMIDNFQSHLKPLKNFILPGGNVIASQLHISRAVCRRAEIQCLVLSQEEYDTNINIILNRLSDLFFTMARFVNTCTGFDDVLWNQSSITNRIK